MFSDLIDRLRCPVPHEAAWLVASQWEAEGRRIVRGELGCPACGHSVPIRRGIAEFNGPPVLTADPVPDAEAAMALAAQLHLVESPDPHLLVGTATRHATALLAVLPHAILLLGDPVCEVPVDPRVGALTLPTGALPLAAGALRSVALDAAHADAAWVAAATRAVRGGGRLVAPAGIVLDAADWTVLATDATTLVAERTATTSAPVALRKAPARPLFTTDPSAA